jgi:2-keto-4-pentenoate hydratase
MIELDPRVRAGMEAQLALRRERLAAGDRHLGWKVGFGAPEAIERLGTDRPLVGFLTRGGLVEDGAEVAVGEWTAPALEPEIAVHLAADVPGDAAWSDVRAAVAGVSAAIELADVSFEPDDVRRILAGNIFQRHVVLGPVRADAVDASAVRARVLRDGEEVAATDDPAAATGEILEVVRLTAELLDAVGERLRAGDVIITGSVVPPLPCGPGQAFTADLEPLGRLTVRLTR